MAAPLTGLAPSQLGIVVDDLDGALQELGGALGDDWVTLRDGTSLVPYRTAEGVREYPMRVVEGRVGPPYVELIEAIEGSTWAPRGTSYLHHVAYEVEDLEATCSELERRGHELVLTQAGETRLQMFGLYRAPSGLLLEIVDAAVVGGRRGRN